MKFQTLRITNLVMVVLVMAFSACRSEEPIPEEPKPEVQVVTSTTPAPIPKPDECCMDPGAISLCWWQDAERDGISCQQPSDCPNGTECVKDGLPGLASPDGAGLCHCSGDSDCGNDGTNELYGICNEDTELCGPSYCNGYKICSCFGGCVDWHSGDYYTPDDLCEFIFEDLPNDGNCCEGLYHMLPGTDLVGYCSDDPSCNNGTGGCTSDEECDDGDVCTTDVCEDNGGCTNTWNTEDCDDGNPCTEDDVCNPDADGECAGTDLVCDDGSVCTSGWCDETDTDDDPCVYETDTSADGEDCDGEIDTDQCTVDQCDDGECVYVEDFVCTDDGNFCTLDSCADPYDTDSSGSPCVSDAEALEGTDCSLAAGGPGDGDACTTGDVCVVIDDYISCAGTGSFDCDDETICTNDSCDPTDTDGYPCIHAATNEDASCEDDPASDGDVCTVDVCNDSGECTGAGDLVCIDGAVDDPCTDNSCDPDDGCVTEPNTDPCDDGNVCTEGSSCQIDGSCAGGTAVTCDDEEPCTYNYCSEADGDPDNSYCYHPTIDNCCEDNDDCPVETICGVTGADAECVLASCDTDTNACVCDATYGASQEPPLGCTIPEEDLLEFPENCYEGICAVSAGMGYCNETLKDQSGNNLCIEAFVGDTGTVLDTSSTAWLGEFFNDDAEGVLAISGSTVCGTNNYYAAGTNCIQTVDDDDDDDTPMVEQNLGFDSPDMVYVFEYETNDISDGQYQLYSYLVKVEADFNVGIYIKTDIEQATDCPGEGGEVDTGFYDVESARCYFPYLSTPMPSVLEDACVNGNDLTGQSCCNANPFTDDPVTCAGVDATCDPSDLTCTDPSEMGGYYWCRRYYPAGCCDYTYNQNCQALIGSDCDGYWEYPDDPHNCTLAQDYDYNHVAAAVISPDGDVDGSKRKAYIFIDGVDGEMGNFYLTVTRQEWTAGPCDRANDDLRLYNVTNADYETSTYTGNLENAVNDTHIVWYEWQDPIVTCTDDDECGDAQHDGWCYAYYGECLQSQDRFCGGYNCSNDQWLGGSDCHASDVGNEFWPNSEYVMISRPEDSGDEYYCFQTDEAAAGMADLVLTVDEMTSEESICSGWSNSVGCVHNNNVVNYGGSDASLDSSGSGGNIEVTFKALAGRTYIIGLSNFEQRDSPCGVEDGDECNYALSVTQGACAGSGGDPVCDDPLETEQGTITINSDSGSWSSWGGDPGCGNDWCKVNNGDGKDYDCKASNDEVWIVENTTSGSITADFTLTPKGTRNTALAIYDCYNEVSQCVSNGGNGQVDTFSATLLPDTPYYIVVESNETDGAKYELEIDW